MHKLRPRKLTILIVVKNCSLVLLQLFPDFSLFLTINLEWVSLTKGKIHIWSFLEQNV